MTFLQLAKEILSKAKYPLTSKEIWEIAKKEKYDEKSVARGKRSGILCEWRLLMI